MQKYCCKCNGRSDGNLEQDRGRLGWDDSQSTRGGIGHDTQRRAQQRPAAARGNLPAPSATFAWCNDTRNNVRPCSWQYSSVGRWKKQAELQHLATRPMPHATIQKTSIPHNRWCHAHNQNYIIITVKYWYYTNRHRLVFNVWQHSSTDLKHRPLDHLTCAGVPRYSATPIKGSKLQTKLAHGRHFQGIAKPYNVAQAFHA